MLLRTSLLAFAVAATAGGAANAKTFEFTSTADWNTGIFASTNGGSDQLQLNPNIVTTFNHIWVAASGRGTVVRINTDSGEVLGEYYTAPNGMGRDPSRTTVDINGDVWVGNRAETSGGFGSIAKISASASGPNTSTGVFNAPTGTAGTFDARPWTNAGSADTNGGTSTAQDVAILNYVRTAGTAARSIAVDASNDVWVGGYNNKAHQKHDGTTGAAESPVLNNGVGGYGAVIDSNGILWTSDWSNNRIGRIDTNTNTVLAPVATGGRSYGLAVDSGGNIWNSHYDQNRISKLDSSGNLLFTVNSGGSLSRGVAVTSDDNIWIANSGSNTVTRLSNTGVILATIPVGGYPTGVAVDNNGKVWVTNYNSSSVMRIDPTGGAAGLGAVDLTVNLGPNANPYNYSDMTGSVIGGITNPTGTWTTVLDGGKPGAEWEKIFWNTEPDGSIPDGTGITLQVRVADLLADLTAQAWQSFASGASLGLLGQFAEVRAILTRTGTGAGAASPILSNLRLTTRIDGPAPIPLPAPILLLLSGLGGLGLLRRRAAGKAA